MKQKFYKVYIELTNVCGLSCSFCPSSNLKPKNISLEQFETILQQLDNYTNDIALHVFGDPLVLSNLTSYLELATKYRKNVHITTTGFYLKNFENSIFKSKSIKQINFSLNSYNKNDMNISFDEYIESIYSLCEYKLEQNLGFFINFRLWNQDNLNSEYMFNNMVLNSLNKKFKSEIKINDLKKGSIRLDNKILLHIDEYFEWPSLSSSNYTDGYCHGLKSQLSILSDGKVVPCCLDGYGVMNLGNIFEKSLDDILSSKRATDIVNGFQNKIAVEELCKKCTYKHRFDII